MATVLDISAEVPTAAIEKFLKACDRYRDELGNSQKVAVRRGTIALVKSLRARTLKSKKEAPLRDVTRYAGPGPKYITPKGKKQTPQPCWSIVRHGGEREKTYVYAAASRSEARKKHGAYSKWGLAKHSWGWFMKSLFHRREDTGGNPKTRITADMAEGNIREVVTGSNPRVEVRLVNKLDYIRAATSEGALAESMEKATKSINAQLDKHLAKAREELENS